MKIENNFLNMLDKFKYKEYNKDKKKERAGRSGKGKRL